MGYDFGKAFLSMMGDQPQDLRTPETKTMERGRMGMSGNMQNEYTNAQNDPNYGLGSPAQQQYMEQELANSVRSRTGASGGDQSGFEGDQVRKALVDFRIGQIANRQNSLNQLRQGMITASTAGQPMGQPVAGVGRSMAGGFGGRAGQGIARSLFGPSEEEILAGQKRAADLGSQPGGNGSRPAGPQTQSGGPGNTAPGNVTGADTSMNRWGF